MTTETFGNGNQAITAGSNLTVNVGNGNDSVSIGSNDTLTVGNGNDVVTAGSNDKVTAGNGNDVITAGDNSTVKVGNGNDAVTVGANSSITAGNGNMALAAGNNSTITTGNGNVAIVAGANDHVTTGNGNAVIFMGANDTVQVGAGNDVFVIEPSATPTLSAPSSLTVNEDGTITLPINVALSQAGFGQEVITGFSSDDALVFQTSQFANAAAVLADARQVGLNTVITADASDTITLKNTRLSSLSAKNFAFVGGTTTSAPISITISGLPADITLSDSSGPLTVVNGSITLTPAQLAGLTLKAGEVTAANLTITATDTANGTSVSQTVALTVNPVAPALTAPTSLTLNANGSVALGLSETPFDPRDTVAITVSGVPSDATLTSASHPTGVSFNSTTHTWTVTPAALADLTLNAGQAGVTTLTVTATNTQGVTASTTDAIALKVNPVLAVNVSVVGNGTVQEGQTLVATATIVGDNADAGAPISYQWQSSSDGGATWNNVGGAVPTNFNGQPSSFLQLTEQNEGQKFRAIASFTDSAHDVITTTSAPTVPVADVTPEIVTPFSYAVDNLSIVKNGTQIYNDNFSQAPIASPDILSNGVPSPIAFITQGSTWVEAGGKAVASSAGVAANPNIGGSAFDIAVLNTNTDATSNLGLKANSSFTVSSTFDLTAAAPNSSYGMELTDGTANHGVDQLERLIVTRVNGQSTVELIQANLVANNTQTVLASHTLTAAELAGNTQIEFQFAHAANSTQVTGSFELINNGTVTSATTFAPAASIFTNGINWTRADVGAFASTTVALNIAPGQSPREGQTLTASAAANDIDATLHYQWQSSADGGQTFTAIAGANGASYVAQESDEGHTLRVLVTTTDPDSSQTATATSPTTGVVLDALPTITTPVVTGTAQEGQTLTASASAGQGDNPVSYAWYSSADGFTTAIGTGATYLVQEGDEGFAIEAKATATNDNGVGVTATSAATSAVLDAAPTITTPVVTGIAQEGQTLTASASSGQGDNAVSYAWYSSANNYTTAIGTGPTYLVQEGDEGFAIEAKATATNDNGVTVTATSAATSAVLDAAPSVTTPVVTGIAQEGQTLTASASSGQGDNPVTYAWYSSADNYTTPIGTGPTYLVQEGDENFTIEAKATATNDNGVTVTATSAATAPVIDNAQLSLAVSVLGNGTVQEGQTLVASATITGDADDANAAVTYQWQSSSDGGATWSNVPATAMGNFNGTLSSLYQLTEGDEGKEFRATASFVDDTGQTIAATSNPTVPVADVTPEIVTPFSYAVDNLSIVKNGTQIYNDNFSQAPIASPDILSNGVPTPIAFVTQGSTWVEAGGKAIATSAGVAGNPNIGGSAFDIAVLNTNTDATSNLGLKANSSFTVSSTFDLTAAAPNSSYGMELTDGTANHGVDQLERLIVTRVNGQATVELIQANLVANNTQTVLASHTLTAAELAGNTQIEFQFAHAANTTQVTGSFELINNGAVTSATTFAPAASIFTNNINWTRADVGAFASTTVALNIAPGQSPREGDTLIASAAANDSDATLHYQWQSSADGGQTFTTIAGAADSASYVAQRSDENHAIRVAVTSTDADSTQSASATSPATGLVIDNASIAVSVSVLSNGGVQEGQTLQAAATITGDPSDATAPVTYQWQSSSDGGANWTNVPASALANFGGAIDSLYQLTEQDEGKLFRASASFTDATGQVVSSTSTPTVPVADVTPEIVTPFSYAVDNLSIVKSGTQIYNDNFSQAPIASPDILSNGVPTPIAFITQGSTWVEGAGKAIATSAGVAGNPNIGGSAFDIAVLNTNTDPTSNLGLKANSSFTVSSTFDLTAAAPNSSYGMELTDGTTNHGVDQLERLIVTRVNGQSTVELIQANLVANNTQTVLASHTLTAAELANNTQIEFQFSHAANSTQVTGSFELIDNGAVTSATTFAPAASIFTNGVNWTRADVGAFANATVALNNPPGQSPTVGQTLTASAAANDSDAALHYQWQDSSDGGATWAAIAGAADSASYTVQSTDQGLELRVAAHTSDPDSSQSAVANSAATGPVSANLALLNQFTAASFVSAGDASGTTAVTVPTPTQDPLATPHV